MAKLISGEIVIGDFSEIMAGSSMFPKWEIKDPLRVMLYQHPQEENKLVVDLSPINPFASKHDKIVIENMSILFWIPDNDKTKAIYNQYNQMITGIVTPDVGNLKLT